MASLITRERTPKSLSISYCNRLFFLKKVYSTCKLKHTIFNLNDAYMAREDHVFLLKDLSKKYTLLLTYENNYCHLNNFINLQFCNAF